MKRVLIITDLGHASPRIPGIASCLPDYGWQASIITPSMSEQQKAMFLLDGGRGLHLLETPEFRMIYQDAGQTTCMRTLARRALRKIGVLQYLEYPDEHIRWRKIAERRAHEEVREVHYDAVLSSSSPVTSHLIARRIAVYHRIPWIADLRDLWTQNHNYVFSPIRKNLEIRLERKILSDAQALITVTPQLQQVLEAEYGNRAHWIPNGYSSLPNPRSARQGEDQFKIVYTGQIYEGKQDIRGFLEAFVDWIVEDRIPRGKVVFQYFGRSIGVVKRYKMTWPDLFARNVEVHGPISLSESHEVQHGADLLLLLNWNDPLEKGVASTKLYEYLATGIPILASGGFGGDYVEHVLATTRAGQYCPSKQSIILALREAYRSFSEKGRPAARIVNEEVRQFSYIEIARNLAGLLDSVIL